VQPVVGLRHDPRLADPGGGAVALVEKPDREAVAWIADQGEEEE
jgi:hypothetical protein